MLAEFMMTTGTKKIIGIRILAAFFAYPTRMNSFFQGFGLFDIPFHFFSPHTSHWCETLTQGPEN